MAFVAVVVSTFVIIQAILLVKTFKKIFPNLKHHRLYKSAKVLINIIPVLGFIIASIIVYFMKILVLNFDMKSAQWSIILHSLFTVYVWINVAFNYLAALVIKPGRPPRKAELLDETTSLEKPDLKNLEALDFCSCCERLLTYGTHHCAKCGDCIRMMCHHSSLVNNCIGINNFSYYFCFLVYAFVGLVYSFYMTFSPFYACYLHDHDRSSISLIYPALSLKICNHVGELPLLFIAVFIAAVLVGCMLFLQCLLLAADLSLVYFVKRIQESNNYISTLKNLIKKSFRKQRRIKYNILLRGSKRSWIHFIIPSMNVMVDDLSIDDIFDEDQCYVQMV